MCDGRYLQVATDVPVVHRRVVVFGRAGIEDHPLLAHTMLPLLVEQSEIQREAANERVLDDLASRVDLNLSISYTKVLCCLR